MKIGIDLDDVLMDFFGPFCAYINKHKGTTYDRNSVTDFYIEKAWGWPKEESYDAFRDYYASPEHEAATPVVGSVGAVRLLSRNHELHIITSKPESLSVQTKVWTDKYFPGMFTGIHFMNHFHGEGKKRLKAEVCRELGIQVYIDDSLEQVRSVSQLGIPIFMPDAPWNQEQVDPPVIRVYSWQEICEGIAKI